MASTPARSIFLKGANELCRAGEGLCRGALCWLVAVWPLGSSGELPPTQLFLLRCGLRPVLEAASSVPLRLLFLPLSPPGYSCHLGTVTHRVSGSCQSRPTALVSGCGCSFLRPQDPELFSQVPCAHGRIGTDSLSASPGWAAGSPGGHHGSTCWDRWDRAVLARLWPWLWGGGSHSSQCRQAGPTATAALGSARAWRLHLRVPPCMRLGASVTLPLAPVSSGWPAVYTSLVGPLPWTRRRLMLWPPPPELMSPNPALLPLSSFEGLLPAPGSCLSCLMF